MSPPSPPTPPSRAEFRQNLVGAFSMGELETLCNDLGIDPELIGGRDQGKEHWADQIILYFEQAGLVDDFVARLKELRSNVAWAYAPDTTDRSQKIIGDVVTIKGNVRDVRLEKNVIKVGTLVVPAVPVLIGILVALALGALAVYLVAVPTKMPEGPDKFNVAVAEFGTQDAQGNVKPSADGAWLSAEAYGSLKRSLTELQQQAGRGIDQITVWHDSDALAKRTPIGFVRDLTDAGRIARDIGAHVVVYGNLAENQNPATFAPKFYIQPARGAWEEVGGPYDFGRPITVTNKTDVKQDAWLVKTLKDRQRLLALFTVGLINDNLGDNVNALRAFNQAASEGGSATDAVGDVVQFFIGRQLLEMDQLDDAELAFRRSISASQTYPRPYTGLGAVDLLRWERLKTPAARLAQSDIIQSARDDYARSLELANQTGIPIQAIARVGLGYVARLEGDTFLQEGNALQRAGQPADETLNRAIEKFDEAAKQLNTAIPDLQRDKLYRLLAQAYLALGAANEQTATAKRLLAQTADAPALLARAADAYLKCYRAKDLSPNDKNLREKTAATCSQFYARVAGKPPD